MKLRRLILALIMLALASTLTATDAIKGYISISPQLIVSVKPKASELALQTRRIESQNTPAIDFGFTVQTEKVSMFANFPLSVHQFADFSETPSVDNQFRVYANLPFLRALDNNFPGLGAIDYTPSENITFSFGRRQICWGYGAYSMAISDSQPYLDNVSATFRLATPKDRTFYYQFLTIGFPQWQNFGLETVQKTFFAHRLGLETKYFNFIFSELNLIYGGRPTLYDAAPLALYHDNFQDGMSNVMIDLQMEAQIKSLRAFASFTMDDMVIGNENNGQPNAMGFSAGIELNLIDNETENQTNLRIQTDNSKKKTGLNIGLDWYFCGAFMYNRAEDSSATDHTSQGRYTVPMHYISDGVPIGDRFYNDKDGYFLGFPFGPDTQVIRLYADYESKDQKLSANLAASLIRKGSQTLNSLKAIYGTSATDNYTALKLNGPVTNIFRIKAQATYEIANKLNLSADLKWDLGYDFTSAIGIRYDI